MRVACETPHLKSDDSETRPIGRKIGVSGWPFKDHLPTYRLALRMTSCASSLPRSVVTLSRSLKRKGRSSCTLHLQAAGYVWQPFESSRYRNWWDAVSGIRSLVYLRIACASWKTVRVHPIVNSRDLPHYYTPPPFFILHALSASLRRVMVIPKIWYLEESFCKRRFFFYNIQSWKNLQ